MRNGSRSRTVPGPIGVHESAPNPSSSSARSPSIRSLVTVWNSASACCARPRSARVDRVLVALPDRVLHVGCFGCLVSRPRSAEAHRLDRGEVHEVVLHAPARQLGRPLPLVLAEVVAHRLDRRPHLFEDVHHLLIVHDGIFPRRTRRRRTAWSGPFSSTDVGVLASREDVLVQVDAVDRVPHLARERGRLLVREARELLVERVRAPQRDKPLDEPAHDVALVGVDVDHEVDRLRQTHEVQAFEDDDVTRCEHATLGEHVVLLVRVHRDLQAGFARLERAKELDQRRSVVALGETLPH